MTPAVRIRRFFDAYARRMNAGLKDKKKVDTKGITAAFADYFVESSPVGVFGGKNGLKFRLLVPRGIAHYRKIGATAMLVEGLKVTKLDDLHFVATVKWDSRYTTKEGKAKRIRFTNLYLLTLAARQPKIFAYVTGDEEKVLRDAGVT